MKILIKEVRIEPACGSYLGCLPFNKQIRLAALEEEKKVTKEKEEKRENTQEK